jgi:hypothetical protein
VPGELTSKSASTPAMASDVDDDGYALAASISSWNFSTAAAACSARPVTRPSR